MDELNIKYPKSIGTAGRKNVVFSANSNFVAMQPEEVKGEISPLTTFKPWASLSLEFANSEEQDGGTGNIEPERIADVRFRTAVAMHEIMKEECRQAGTVSEKSEAQKLLETPVYLLPKEYAGLKGKSVYEIAKTIGGGGAQACAANLEEFASRNARYTQSNLQQAEALRVAAIVVESKRTVLPSGKTVADLFAKDPVAGEREAQALYAGQHPAGPLAAEAARAVRKYPSLVELFEKEPVAQAKVLKIYGPVTKTPNVNKVDQNGYTRVYQLAISCHTGHVEYPFRVELTTMLGIPLKDHSVGVQGNTIKDRKTFQIDLQTWEWINMIDRADWEKKMVEMMFHDSAYQLMLKANEENYLRRRQKAQNARNIPGAVSYPQGPDQNIVPFPYPQDPNRNMAPTGNYNSGQQGYQAPNGTYYQQGPQMPQNQNPYRNQNQGGYYR